MAESSHDFFDERMTDYVPRIKPHKGYPLNIAQQFHASGQSTVAFSHQIYLTGITCNNKFCISAHSGQEHLQL